MRTVAMDTTIFSLNKSINCETNEDSGSFVAMDTTIFSLNNKSCIFIGTGQKSPRRSIDLFEHFGN